MRGFQCILLCAALLYTTSAFDSCGNDGSDGPDNAECDGYSGDSCTSFECECKRGFEEIDITTDGQATTVCIGMK